MPPTMVEVWEWGILAGMADGEACFIQEEFMLVGLVMVVEVLVGDVAWKEETGLSVEKLLPAERWLLAGASPVLLARELPELSVLEVASDVAVGRLCKLDTGSVLAAVVVLVTTDDTTSDIAAVVVNEAITLETVPVNVTGCCPGIEGGP